MTTAPYGSWRSPIDAATSIAGGIGFSNPVVDHDNIYWIESRPAEKGRSAIMRLDADGTETELIAAPWSARTRVHEYGGGAYAVKDGIVIFSNDADGRVYKIESPATDPVPLTPDVPDRQLRYAAFAFDLPRRRFLAVREDHRGKGEAINTLVAVSLDNGDDEGAHFAGGHDFIGPVALNPSATMAAAVAWDHPNMPWDDTVLYVITLDDAGMPVSSQVVAGSSPESVMLPEWADDDTLIFVSDRSEYWNLYRYRISDGTVVRLAPADAEFAYPQWKFGMTYYAIVDPRTIFAASTHLATWSLQRIDIETGVGEPITSDYTDVNGVSGGDGVAVFVGSSPTSPSVIARYDAATGRIDVVKASKDAPDLEVEGEMHGDTALSEALRMRNFPHSRLKGSANLLVMPTLDAANIAYELIKAMTDALPVGPILVGGAKPAHILTPSVTARGVVNMTAVAAVEAQQMSQG